MDNYDRYSREELVRMVRELKARNEALAGGAGTGGADNLRFKERYALRILDSLPDMLTVLDHDGHLVELVSSEETNHVGEPSDRLIGRDICSMLTPEAYHSVKDNLDRVAATRQGSTSHHDITLDECTRHYENRIFPLDERYALCMCRDVTEEIRAKEELVQANRRMTMAEEMASLCHWYYYEETDELDAPQLIALIAGRADSSRVGRVPGPVFMPHVHPADQDKLVRQLGSGSEADNYVEYRIRTKGRTRYFHSRIIHVREERGYRVVEGYAQDMTYVVKRLHELEAVKYALNNAVEEIYACRLDGTLEFASRAFIERHGLTGEVGSYRIYDLEGAAFDERQWRSRVTELRGSEGSDKYTARLKGGNGEQLTYEVINYIVYDEAKECELVWGFVRDISLRVAHENRIRELNYVMDAILNNIPVYLFVKDPSNEFRYLYWNKAFEEHSHIPASVALGRTDFEIFPSIRDAEKFRKDDLALLRTGERVEFIEEYMAANGQKRVVSTSKALVPAENKLPLIIGVSWDITDMKRAEQELIAARIKAEVSDRLKSAFLANMSHEIRTPLNAIVGFSRMVASAETDEEKQQYTEIIDSNAELLLQLINDILDLSKIEAGTLDFNFQPMDLVELCREEYEIHKSRMRDGVALVFDRKYEQARVVSDHNRLAQVITNLLSNAIKFTSQGEIRFGFDIRSNMAEFYVSDTGSGIPADKLPTIFDRFIKLDSSAAGTGLGLAISKTIVEKMGGTISAESREGEGTTFRFTVPLRCGQEAVIVPGQPVAAPQAPGHGAAIPAGGPAPATLLIAEDIDSNYMLMKAFLGKRYRLVRAHNGQEAVELFGAERPDLVFMDIKMPIMDGYEATRRIRRLSADVPIIAITAFAFESDREKVLAAGCTDYLTKPLSQQMLNQKIAQYLPNAAADTVK